MTGIFVHPFMLNVIGGSACLWGFSRVKWGGPGCFAGLIPRCQYEDSLPPLHVGRSAPPEMCFTASCLEVAARRYTEGRWDS